MRMLSLLALLVLVSCQGGGSRGGSGLPDVKRRVSEPSRGDRRVVMFQKQSSTRAGQAQTVVTRIIAVNEGHSYRATPEGRLALADGDPNQGYVVLSEQNMENLLQSIENRGFSEVCSPMQPGDEIYLSGRADDSVSGAVMVEVDGNRRILVGRRPRRDPSLIAPYRVYTELKVLSAMAGNGQTEIPSSAQIMR